MGSPVSMVSDTLNKRLSKVLGVAVVAPSYALAPERPFPSAVVDAYDALSWLSSEESLKVLDESFSRQQISILGESAVSINKFIHE